MSDSLAAPPPYELSSQELDKKVNAAIQESITVLSNSNEEEIWEDWDEAVFEAAATQSARYSDDAEGPSSTLAQPSTSSWPCAHPPEKAHSALSCAQPLRINKKAKVQLPSTPSKDRPCWFEEAGLGRPNSSSTEGARSSQFTHPANTDHPSSSSGFSTRQFTHQLPPDEEEDQSIAPPPFTAVGPSLDGPPFEEVDSTTYPDNAHASPPPSPLLSPTTAHSTLPAPSVMVSPLLHTEARHSPRQSFPAPPRSYVRLGPRPASSIGNVDPRLSVTTPVVSFDPSVAYTKPGPVAFSGVQPCVNEVPSFYNSAVAALVTSRPSRPVSNVPPPRNLYPSQRPRSSLHGHSALSNNDYDQYPSHPINPSLPTLALPSTALEQPQQLQQYQHQHHSDPRMRPASLQGQWSSQR